MNYLQVKYTSIKYIFEDRIYYFIGYQFET